jgi:hypothetical protein
VRRIIVVVFVLAGFAAISVAPAAGAPLSDADLEQALLAPEDMPEEQWAEAAAGTIEGRPGVQSEAPGDGWCGGGTDSFLASEAGSSGSATTTLSKVVSPDEPYWFIWQALWSFETTGGAKQHLAAIEQQINGCTTWQDFGGEIQVGITPEIISWPKVGKQRLAVEVLTSGDGVSETTHVIYVRVANHVLAIHSRILPPDETLLRKIVKRATKLLKDAAADAA